MAVGDGVFVGGGVLVWVGVLVGVAVLVGRGVSVGLGVGVDGLGLVGVKVGKEIMCRVEVGDGVALLAQSVLKNPRISCPHG